MKKYMLDFVRQQRQQQQLNRITTTIISNVTTMQRRMFSSLFESDSSKIIRTIKSNKIPGSLSRLLDTTLKDSHDMKIFGFGTLATMSSKERYKRFTYSMYGIYTTMEYELDHSTSDAVQSFWSKHHTVLRRSSALQQDLADVGMIVVDDKNTNNNIYYNSFSNATKKYIDRIRLAGEMDRQVTNNSNNNNNGGGRILGHAYTRYLADLMGGSVLAYPTRLALNLDIDTPRHYTFQYNSDTSNNVTTTTKTTSITRKEYVEQIYHDLNKSGTILVQSNDNNNTTVLEDVVDEARKAFQHNIDVYSEEPIYLDAMVGTMNILYGYVTSKTRR